MPIQKKVLASILTASLILSIPISTSAMSKPQETIISTETASTVERVIDGQTFSISPDAVGKLTDSELQAIAQQATGTGNIIIQNVTMATNALQTTPSTSLKNTVSPYAWYDTYTIWSVTKNVTQRDTPLAAEQITSVGQAQEKTIKTTYKISSNVSASASYSLPSSLKAEISAGLASEMSREINVKYSGPPVGSSVLSYIFWITKFVNRGTYSATGEGNLSGDKYGPYLGTWEEPNKFVEWTQEIR